MFHVKPGERSPSLSSKANCREPLKDVVLSIGVGPTRGRISAVCCGFAILLFILRWLGDGPEPAGSEDRLGPAAYTRGGGIVVCSEDEEEPNVPLVYRAYPATDGTTPSALWGPDLRDSSMHMVRSDSILPRPCQGVEFFYPRPSC